MTEHSKRSRLVYRLCRQFLGDNVTDFSCSDEALRLFHHVSAYLKTCTFEWSRKDDVLVVERIKKRLQQTGSDDDVKRFCTLNRRLESGKLLKNWQAVLAFLESVSRPLELKASVAAPPPLLDMAQAPPSTVTVRRNKTEWLQLERKSHHPALHGTTDIVQMRPHASKDIVPVMSINEIRESVLLQEVVYAFQGIPGKVLKLDAVSQDFKVDSKVNLTRAQKAMVLHLAELGFLYIQLKRFCDEADFSRTLGLMEKSLVSAIRDELTEYYRLVALVEAQVQQLQEGIHKELVCVDSPLSEEQERPPPPERGALLTLRRLRVWALEPQTRLRLLVSVTQASRSLKGGALASCVYGFLQSGYPAYRSTIKHLLATVCRPLYIMLSRWMLDGELEDPYKEFFIVANVDVKGDRLWHEKYRVQEKLVPCFIPLAQAKKILATGKSINFLREVCQDYIPVKGREQLRHVLECTSVEALFMPDRDGDLQAVMDTAYLETSRRVLDVLNGPHMFMENLQALRRYLLLGQGDFIRHLMEIIDPELQKPASQLYPHNLSGILETAIRSTNAQFEDADILQRLDVRMLEASPGDTGWDVFSLDYHVVGPIGTVFGPTAMSYLMLFNALWRSKRMEYILSVTWKRQITSTKMLRKLPELAPILQHTHLLTAEMIHLVHQMQYYTLFEVLECSWHALIKDVHQAEALDDIIRAHDRFLTKVKMGALLDEDSQELSAQLRAVYDLILQLQVLEDRLHTRSLEELKARSARDERVEVRAESGDYGTTRAEEMAEAKQRQDFVDFYLPYVHAQLRVLTKSYQDVVKKFLLLLASHPDVSLQLLSVRLDFNEHYKRSDSRLAVPYTYQHRRLSELAYRPSVK